MAEKHKYMVLCGMVLVSLCKASNYGNLFVYIYSVHWSTADPDAFDIDASYIYPLFFCFKALGTVMADLGKKRIGLKLTTGLAIIMFVSSIFLTYFTVTYSFWATALTFMGGAAIGNGMMSVSIDIYAAHWFKSNVGTAVAFPNIATCVGGIIVNLISTVYINPDNLVPDSTKDGIKYFSQSSLIDRVPIAFLLLGALAAGSTGIGFLLLRDPPKYNVKIDNTCFAESDTTCLGHEEQGYLSETMETPLYTSEKEIHPNSSSFNDSPDSSAFSTESNRELSDSRERVSLSNNTPDGQSIMDNGEVGTSDMTTSQAVKCELFYILSIGMMIMNISQILVVNYFKAFGEMWIRDDFFLAITASLTSLSSMAFHFICGILIDLIGSKNTIVAHQTGCVFFLALWYVTGKLNKWLYLMWTVILVGMHMNRPMLYSLACLEYFGKQRFASIFGLIHIPSMVSIFTLPYLMMLILKSYGWFWLFFMQACITFVSLILTILRMS